METAPKTDGWRRHPIRWLLMLLAVFFLASGGVLQLARQRATDSWSELARSFEQWADIDPKRYITTVQMWERAYKPKWKTELPVPWPRNLGMAHGSISHAWRHATEAVEDRYTLGWYEFEVDQNRHWLAIHTHVRFTGENEPPKSLVAALREVLGEDGVEVVVEP